MSREEWLSRIPPPTGTFGGRTKGWVVTSPLGEEIEIRGLHSFCKANGLSESAMGCVARGASTTHKGWKCRAAEFTPEKWASLEKARRQLGDGRLSNYTVTSPTGERTRITNLKEFQKLSGMPRRKFRATSGVLPSHDGWTVSVVS